MDSGLMLLCASAAAVAVIHTLAGPDHYVPFVAMARARDWTLRRTAGITLACGVGHIASSVALGVAAALGGIELQRIAQIESTRGSLATWALLAFGAVYLVWGVRRAARARPHRHAHWHAQTGFHAHAHVHHDEHVHVHDAGTGVAADAPAARSITPWVLFAIFVFGPCEPMIPLVMVPAADRDWLGLALLTLTFGGVTLATMLLAVVLGVQGTRRIWLGAAERYTHALAGFTLLLTGGAMMVFGL